MCKTQKVYYLGRVHYDAYKKPKYSYVPHIRLAGDWLADLGYRTGDHITITTNTDGSITIRKEACYAQV